MITVVNLVKCTREGAYSVQPSHGEAHSVNIVHYNCSSTDTFSGAISVSAPFTSCYSSTGDIKYAVHIDITVQY